MPAPASRLPADPAPRRARADDRVQFINEQNHPPVAARHLAQHRLQPLLEFAAELGARQQLPDIEPMIRWFRIASGQSPFTMRALALRDRRLATPGSPIRTGCSSSAGSRPACARRISSSLPITGSGLPSPRPLRQIDPVLLQRLKPLSAPHRSRSSPARLPGSPSPHSRAWPDPAHARKTSRAAPTTSVSAAAAGARCSRANRPSSLLISSAFASTSIAARPAPRPAAALWLPAQLPPEPGRPPSSGSLPPGTTDAATLPSRSVPQQP